MLDDYFSSSEFLGSVDAGVALEATNSVGSACTTPTNTLQPSTFVDSGIGLNLMASPSGIGLNNNAIDDDEVFLQSDKKIKEQQQPGPNSLTRSRRSHFSHKDMTAESSELTAKSAANEKGMHGMLILNSLSAFY